MALIGISALALLLMAHLLIRTANTTRIHVTTSQAKNNAPNFAEAFIPFLCLRAAPDLYKP
jgi:uncharacterized membrane protein (Fun14 family)